MNEVTQVEFVVRQDALGRIGSISVKDRLYSGWALMPSQSAARIQLLQCTVLPKYPPHSGQGQMMLRGLDQQHSDPSLRLMNLTGGLLVASHHQPCLLEMTVEICLKDDSVGSWLNSPEVEQRLRQTDPDLFEAPPSLLELGVWYPVELAEESCVSGYGVFQIMEKRHSSELTANVRCVLMREGVSFRSMTLLRFGRIVGCITNIISG